MLKIGNLRVGKGLALILPEKQMIVGGGTKQFQRALTDEVGIDRSRPHRGWA
jgi:hypothetical protein